MENKNPPLPDKEFFSMGEVSAIVQLPAHTLRYWEERIRLLRPARRSSGHRRYSRADVETILQIKELLLQRKMTLAGARKALLARQRGLAPAAEESAPRGPTEDSATLKLLREVRRELQSLVDELR